MVGYTEALTDPSYNGQLLTLTYPLVGNYGVPDPAAADRDGIPMFFESDKIQARGLVVHELSHVASHWNMHMTLDEWMYNEGIPGISGIDTRALTKGLRSGGVRMAALAVSDDEICIDDITQQLAGATPYTSEQFMNTVSVSAPRAYGCSLHYNIKGSTQSGASQQPNHLQQQQQQKNSSDNNTFKDSPKPIIVIDTGTKHAILRNLRHLGYGAILVPWDTTYDEIMSYNPAGVVLSSGPGDPENCLQTIKTAKSLIENDIPTLGICLGAQILGLAGNATTYKLKYGHRGQNKPCTNLATGQTFVTSQNHGYGISPESLEGSEFEMWFTNADDRTVEGIKHRSSRCIAVQFHPEAAPGPYDCEFVFDDLKRLIEYGAINGDTRQQQQSVAHKDDGAQSMLYDSPPSHDVHTDKTNSNAVHANDVKKGTAVSGHGNGNNSTGKSVSCIKQEEEVMNTTAKK